VKGFEEIQVQVAYNHTLSALPSEIPVWIAAGLTGGVEKAYGNSW